MSIKFNLYIIFLFSFLFLGSISSYAQKSKDNNQADSFAIKKHIADSTRDARQQAIEIEKNARLKSLDSAKNARMQEIETAKEKRQQYLDSAKDARQRIMESTRVARQRMMDSAKDARQRIMDSTKEVRQQRMDSMLKARKASMANVNAIRKYKESKHYKDSVNRVQIAKAKMQKAKREAYIDSLTTARKHVTDSMTKARNIIIAAMHEKIKRRTDSLERIRKYRESKRYRDSVAVFKKVRMDSIAKVRKHFTDSITTYRKHFTDSITKSRKHVTDSLTALRSKRMDALKDSRKKRADSLISAKTKRENALKAEQKKKEQKQQLALDLKIKKQREAWSNESMLKKKWSLKRKIVQNTFTRYNYYFNANRKMDEALANMQRVKKENYDTLIELYPFNPNRDSTLLSSDMDSILHKVSVGIQIHDPRSKWDDDLYLLMGEAQYYKGRYNDAAVAFHYIISMDEQRKKKQGLDKKKGTEPSIVEKDKKTMLDFLKHKSVHNEAVLWMSRTFTEANQPEKAESVLALLDADSNLPKNLTGRVALERAFLALNEHSYKEASKQLGIAYSDRNLPDWLRERAGFMNGQLLQMQGEYAASAEAFDKVLDLNPKIDMDFYARKYMAFNTMYAGNDQDGAKSALKKVLDDNKYSAYYEQVYFVLGMMSAKNSDYSSATDLLQKGIHQQKTTKKQKAISFAALGNVYYSEGDYVAAKHAYDSSAKFASYAPFDSMVVTAVTRSKALDDVTGPALTLHEQDSLLALALLSNKDQRNVVRKYIRLLEQQRRDSIFRAENAGIASVAAVEPEEGGTTSIWYFSSSTMMQQGFNEFKRKWGNRPNVDNWRRTAGIAFSGNSNNSGLTNTGSNLESGSGKLDDNGIPTEEFLLSAIPTTTEQLTNAYKLVQTAYADLAEAYVNKLRDYSQAIRTLDTLQKRFPTNEQQARIIYLRYIIALRQHDFDNAKVYAKQLLDDYPASEYAKKVKPSEDAATNGPAGITVGAFYEETYKMLMGRQYNEVITRVDQADKLYKDGKYKFRFQLVDAMAYAGAADYGHADTVLFLFFKASPPDSLRIIGEAIRNYITKNKPATAAVTTTTNNNNPSSNINSMNKTLTNANNGQVPSLPGNDSSKNGLNGPASNDEDNGPGYHYSPNAEHYCAVAIPGLDARAMGLKAAIGDFNSFNYGSKLYVNMDILTPQQAVLVVKSFKNADEAKAYLTRLKATDKIFSQFKNGELHAFIISAHNYVQLFVDRTVTNYLGFYSLNYKQ